VLRETDFLFLKFADGFKPFTLLETNYLDTDAVTLRSGEDVLLARHSACKVNDS